MSQMDLFKIIRIQLDHVRKKALKKQHKNMNTNVLMNAIPERLGIK